MLAIGYRTQQKTRADRHVVALARCAAGPGPAEARLGTDLGSDKCQALTPFPRRCAAPLRGDRARGPGADRSSTRPLSGVRASAWRPRYRRPEDNLRTGHP